MDILFAYTEVRMKDKCWRNVDVTWGPRLPGSPVYARRMAGYGRLPSMHCMPAYLWEWRPPGGVVPTRRAPRRVADRASRAGRKPGRDTRRPRIGAPRGSGASRAVRALVRRSRCSDSLPKRSVLTRFFEDGCHHKVYCAPSCCKGPQASLDYK
jgi:hypothetical protein